VHYGSKLSPNRADNVAWDVFQYAKDRSVLNEAKKLVWSVINKTTNPAPEDVDTYANLLYKLGNRKEALVWQEMAVRLVEKRPADDPTLIAINANYRKMVAGEQTWNNN